MDKKELGIYIHIPFCKKKCEYCDFVSFENCSENIQEEYVKCLIKEIQYNIDIGIFNNYRITTIYIGGGTPSYIKSKYIEGILKKIYEIIPNNELENTEITLEINPGTLTNEKLENYKQSKINRISIGVQSTNNTLLKMLGRIHTYEEFYENYKLLKNIGFSNINVDFMIGLPNQTLDDIQKCIEQIKRLSPKHVSVYSLILEENTKLFDKINSNELEVPNEDLERKMYWKIKKELENLGYIHYEISNFAKKGYFSKHNLNCWEQKEYIGFGVNAHSYLNRIRFSNTENIKEYIKNINEKNYLENRKIHEIQTIEQEQNEFMLLGLRKIKGVSINSFKEKFNQNPLSLYKEIIVKLEKEGLLKVEQDNICLTSKGIDCANLVWVEFV